MRKVGILGVGLTSFGKHEGTSVETLAQRYSSFHSRVVGYGVHRFEVDWIYCLVLVVGAVPGLDSSNLCSNDARFCMGLSKDLQ